MEVIKYIVSIAKWILIALAVILLIGLLLGFRIYILESDSMSPKYPKGSVVVLDSNTRAEEIGIDDVVGLMVGDGLVFHRVIALPSTIHSSTSDVANISGASTASSSIELTVDKGAGTEDGKSVAEAGLAADGVGWRLAGDRDPEKWTEVEIKNSNLLGKLALAIPGLGGVTGLFIHRAWIGWSVAGLILICVLVPWNRVGKRVKADDIQRTDSGLDRDW